jgi:hypothetical protein
MPVGGLKVLLLSRIFTTTALFLFQAHGREQTGDPISSWSQNRLLTVVTAILLGKTLEAAMVYLESFQIKKASQHGDRLDNCITMRWIVEVTSLYNWASEERKRH